MRDDVIKARADLAFVTAVSQIRHRNFTVSAMRLLLTMSLHIGEIVVVAVDKEKRSSILLANLEKAVRRGKKLERTLLKIVTRSEPGSPHETLLKAVQDGVKALKKEAKGLTGGATPGDVAADEAPPAPKPERRRRTAAKEPLPAVKRVRRKPAAPAPTIDAPTDASET